MLVTNIPPLTENKLTIVRNTPEGIDNIITRRIEELTAENSSVWSSPNHSRREYAHSFFQYPAMMVPIVQKKIVDIIKQAAPHSQKVIDPFMGSATSLVACMEKGFDCYGQDINPLSILIAKARTGPFYTKKGIRKKYEQFITDIENDTCDTIEVDFKGIDKWFKKSVQIELSKIVRAIRTESRPWARRFYWINLAEVIRMTSNDRTSTFKLHARPLDEIELRTPSPIKEFKTRLTNSIEDLEAFGTLLQRSDQLYKGEYKGKLNLRLQDSSVKIKTPKNEDEFFDLLVTSPPYGDNKTTVTYGQHSYLPLQWIDLHDIDRKASEEFLKSTSEIDTRALGGRIKKLTQDELEYLFERSNTFQVTYERLLADPKAVDKAPKVVSFLKDLFQVVENTYSAMKVNSYQVWTIGNRTVGGIVIPNNQILQEFIEFKGGKFVTQVKREILNRRMPKKNSNSELMSFEDILIFRKVD